MICLVKTKLFWFEMFYSSFDVVMYPPYECTRGGGGYYGLVVVTLARV